jgi:hypothetical protein
MDKKNKDLGIEIYGEFIYAIGIGIFTGIIAGISIQSTNNNPISIKINIYLLLSGLILILVKEKVKRKNIYAIVLSLISLMVITSQLFDYISF